MEDGAAVVRGIYEAFDRRDFDSLMAPITDETVVTVMAFGQDLKGSEGFRQFTAPFTEAFPDISIEVRNLVAEGDQVAAELLLHGTHSGPLRGPMGDIAPTGNTIDVAVAEIWELQDGKVSRLRNYLDPGTLMRQLSVG